MGEVNYSTVFIHGPRRQFLLSKVENAPRRPSERWQSKTFGSVPWEGASPVCMGRVFRYTMVLFMS